MAYCWWLKSCTSWYGEYPIIYMVVYISKVVSTHLWNTPLNLLPTGYEGIPFIVGLGDCLGCALRVCCNFLGTSHVVQDFFHQQYDHRNNNKRLHVWGQRGLWPQHHSKRARCFFWRGGNLKKGCPGTLLNLYDQLIIWMNERRVMSIPIPAMYDISI